MVLRMEAPVGRIILPFIIPDSPTITPSVDSEPTSIPIK
jgi:hypothetical protein